MYSFKEKKHHFAALRNPAVAGHDLRLLQKANPAEPRLETFKRNPGRYADDILYALLDCVSREEIRNNRRRTDSASHASDAEEELKARAEEAEAAKEVAEQRAEEAEQALEEEKKSSGQGSRKIQKQEEYPQIDWDNLFDPQVQMATLIYNDRVVTWKQMKQLDERLDKKPAERDIMDMVELRIRNLQAFDELQSFNDTGKFLYIHPLIAHRSERAQLAKLMKTDPQEFLRQHKNVADNIRRYESYLKRADRQTRRAQDKENLRRHREREALFKAILLDESPMNPHKAPQTPDNAP